MLFSVEQAFVGRDENRAPLKRLRGRLRLRLISLKSPKCERFSERCFFAKVYVSVSFMSTQAIINGGNRWSSHSVLENFD